MRTHRVCLCLILACGLYICGATPSRSWPHVQDPTLNRDWLHHKAKYNLHFAPDEEKVRFDIYKTNLERMTTPTNTTHKVGPGPFTHLTHQEFRTRMRLGIGLKSQVVTKGDAILQAGISMWKWMCTLPHRIVEAFTTHLTPIVSRRHQAFIRPVVRPTTVDWRVRGKVSSVKFQDLCGSCWAFTTAASIESCIAIRDNSSPVDLSTENLVDCLPAFGCTGGDPATAMDWVQTHGLATSKQYPDTSSAIDKVGVCHTVDNGTDVATVRGHHLITSGGTLALMEAVELGPLVVLIDTNADVEYPSFKDYSSGIISNCANQKDGAALTIADLDHAVLLVGYGTENGTDYWLIKNSWSEGWGEQGYFRIKRVNGQGQCGINMYGVQPIC